MAHMKRFAAIPMSKVSVFQILLYVPGDIVCSFDENCVLLPVLYLSENVSVLLCNSETT